MNIAGNGCRSSREYSLGVGEPVMGNSLLLKEEGPSTASPPLTSFGISETSSV